MAKKKDAEVPVEEAPEEVTEEAAPKEEAVDENTEDATEKMDASEETAAEEAVEEESTEESASDDTLAESSSATATGQTDDRGRELYEVTCGDCGQKTQVPFEPSSDKPVYCKECYSKHRPPRRRFGGGGGRFGGGNRGGGGGFNRGPREMHDVICADCGQSTQVPFKPNGDRPVYCRDCYQKHKKPRY